jgi:uncharacterized protein (DUF433 family)
MSSNLPTPRIHDDRPPLRVVDGGAIRVGDTRITLDLIVEQFENGMSPEELVLDYDSLSLPDVYRAIAYYLRHKAEVQEYMKAREDEAEQFRAEIEAKCPPITRSELLARKWARDRKRERTCPAVPN